MTVACVVQARMGSSRLPGKVLAHLGGRPALDLLLDRIAPLVLGGTVDLLIVATSTLEQDDAIAEHCATRRTDVFRGSERDVLGRFAGAVAEGDVDTVVRLTADCPLMDPSIVAAALEVHRASGADYTSNTLIRTFPDGLDVEVLSAEALVAADEEATEAAEREHVTPFLYRRPARFTLGAFTSGQLLGDERWTLDTPADLEWLREVVRALDDPVGDGWRTIATMAERHGRPEPGGPVIEPLTPAGAADVAMWAGTATMSAVRLDDIEGTRPDHVPLTNDPGARAWLVRESGRLRGWVSVTVDDGIGVVRGACECDARGLVVDALRGALARDAQVVELRDPEHDERSR